MANEQSIGGEMVRAMIKAYEKSLPQEETDFEMEDERSVGRGIVNAMIEAYEKSL